MIQKLYSISQELLKEKFHAVQVRIAHKYDEIERLMIEEFVAAHRTGNRQRMHEIASILVDFKVFFCRIRSHAWILVVLILFYFMLI